MPVKEKHIPMRKCISCRGSFPQSDLYRITLCESELILDKEIKSSGRGCYICKNPKCIEDAMKKNAFARNYRRSISKDEIEKIGRYLNAK